MQTVEDLIKENIETKKGFLSQSRNIETAATKMIECLKKGNKILLCGNGGSAADSQHIAAELVGRYHRERKGLAAIALTTDTSILTAWSNDYEYATVFSRQVEALGKKGDILIAISTSGNSLNVLKTAETAKKMGIIVVSFTGKDGGKLKPLSDVNVNVESQSTARIQECHLLAYHIICELIDREFAK